MQIYARLSLKCNIISEYLVTHCIVSRKFQELISEINLRVAYDKITTRNLSNFLKICQNLIEKKSIAYLKIQNIIDFKSWEDMHAFFEMLVTTYS